MAEMKDLGHGVFEANGAELLRQAVADWEEFNDGEESFADWFPECTWIHADMAYQFSSDLQGITGVSK